MGKQIRGIKEMIEVTREEERQTRGREIESDIRGLNLCLGGRRSLTKIRTKIDTRS